MEYQQFILDYLHKEKDEVLFPLQNIPNIDLYVDQVISLLDGSAKDFYPADHDKSLTKTMINNYTKSKVIPPPINKKYGREHIILILLTLYLKPILSIKEIKTIFDSLNEDVDAAADLDMTTFYDHIDAVFTQNKSSFLENLEQDILDVEEKQDRFQGKDDLRLIRLILILALEANINISLAKTLIDKYLADKTPDKAKSKPKT